MRFSSSCWLCRRRCSSSALLPLYSTGDVSALRPDLAKLIWNGRLMRDGFRKSNVNAEPMESGPSNKTLNVCFKCAFYIHSKRRKKTKTCKHYYCDRIARGDKQKRGNRFYKYCSSLSKATLSRKDSHVCGGVKGFHGADSQLEVCVLECP